MAYRSLICQEKARPGYGGGAGFQGARDALNRKRKRA